MKEVTMTKDFTVTLFGQTMPKNLIYGKIKGTTYTYDFCGDVFKVWNGENWEKKEMTDFPKIQSLIMNFVKDSDFTGHPLEYCRHDGKQGKRNAMQSYCTRKGIVERGHMAVSGAPLRKEIQTEYVFKATSRPMSTETGFSSGEFCRGPVDDGKKSLPKRDGMKTPQLKKEEKEKKRREEERSAARMGKHSKEEMQKIYGSAFTDASPKRSDEESFVDQWWQQALRCEESGMGNIYR